MAWVVPPNLRNYETARRDFSWARMRRGLDGLPGGAGLNVVSVNAATRRPQTHSRSGRSGFSGLPEFRHRTARAVGRGHFGGGLPEADVHRCRDRLPCLADRIHTEQELTARLAPFSAFLLHRARCAVGGGPLAWSSCGGSSAGSICHSCKQFWQE